MPKQEQIAVPKLERVAEPEKERVAVLKREQVPDIVEENFLDRLPLQNQPEPALMAFEKEHVKEKETSNSIDDVIIVKQLVPEAVKEGANEQDPLPSP